MIMYNGNCTIKKVVTGRVIIGNDKHTEELSENKFNINAEIKSFDKALSSAMDYIEDINEQLIPQDKTGSDQKEILEITSSIMKDPLFVDMVKHDIIQNHVGVRKAIDNVVNYFCNLFNQSDSEIINCKTSDIKGVKELLNQMIDGTKMRYIGNDTDFVLFQDDITPIDFFSINRKKLMAVVTRNGSMNSHAAVLLKGEGIPLITGIDFSNDIGEKWAEVNGITGKVIIDTEYNITTKKSFFDTCNRQNRLNIPPEIKVFVNINSIEELQKLKNNTISGIGLFRTEYMAINELSFPDEEKQYSVYSYLAKAMPNKEIVIRTFDFGGDKIPKSFSYPFEINPAMGLRGIRWSLLNPQHFKTQIKAILRAAAYGDISILYPMIGDVSEIYAIKKLMEEAKNELRKDGKKYKEVHQGIMIETPAAVWLSDILAKEVDFFCIGTNDLTQFTLAVDRQNTFLENKFNVCHEAVIKSIEMVTKNAHMNSIRVNICGEIDTDLKIIKRLVDIGIDGVSVPPSLLNE